VRREKEREGERNSPSCEWQHGTERTRETKSTEARFSRLLLLLLLLLQVEVPSSAP